MQTFPEHPTAPAPAKAYQYYVQTKSVPLTKC